MISFVFILLKIAPGDPSLKYVSPELAPELRTKVQESFGLNKPITEQYFLYIKNVFTGNLGISYTYNLPVTKVIKRFLPFTILFGAAAFLVQILFAFLLTYISLLKNNRIYSILNGASLFIYSIPTFVLGVFLIYIFCEKLGILPSSGITSLNSDSFSLLTLIADYFLHLLLPLITVSLGGIALFYRYIRDNVNEITNKNYIFMFNSFGVGRKEIILKHIIPNAISPLISIAGVELGILLSGVLITEIIFSLPGMGSLTLSAVNSRDYPLAAACTLISGIIIIVSNLLADLIKKTIDPRIKVGVPDAL